MTLAPESDTPPARAPWPPILVAGAVVLGRALDLLTDGALGGLASFPGATALGGLIVVLALANDAWCFITLSRHRTTILPHRAASALATDGPFRWSRNPIYVSHVAVVLGLGLLLNSPFTMLLAAPVAFFLQKLSIEPEERHLLGKFGDAYRAYMARTRRWL
jgi:protein-S-isoprenylcysteine O-methyltransferase Ste14